MAKATKKKSKNEVAKCDGAPVTKIEEKAWDAAVNELRERKRDITYNLLQLRYDVGLLAASVIAARDGDSKKQFKYGARTVADVASALKESQSTVYMCLRLARAYTPAQLEHLKKNEWPWRGVMSLLTVESQAKRIEFQQEWEAGKHQEHGESLKDAIEKYNQEQRSAGKRTENRGRRSSVLSPLKSAMTMLRQTTNQVLPGVLTSVQHIKSRSEELTEDQITKARKSLEEIGRLMEREQELVQEFMTAVESIDEEEKA
jgi:flagellar hook-basal body complex protein FliE